MKDALDRLGSALASLEAAQIAAQARVSEIDAEFEAVGDGERRPPLTEQLERLHCALLVQVREELREQLLPIHHAIRLLAQRLQG